MDVNCDLGEGVGEEDHDSAIMTHITSASIACGGHVGDPETMATTVRTAIAAGVVVGAHPSYPDRENFGRVSVAIEPADLTRTVADQLEALIDVCAGLDTSVQYVKLHGALYNDAARNASIAEAVLDGITLLDASLPILTLPDSALGKLARDRGIRVFTEAFPDRGYQPDGTLTPRTHPNAVIHDPARVAERALRLVQHGLIDASDGFEIAVDADSICIHGDAPNAVDAAAAISDALSRHGITPQPFVR
jgi:UPF0271 protein